MEQGELFQAETWWFHLFKTMIDGGDAARMGPYAFMVYCVIKSHASKQSGEAWPSIETVAKKSGISERKIKEELQTLERMGYITKVREGRNNRYTLREKIEIADEQGLPTAIATWDYLPAGVQAAVADIKNVLVSGDLAGAKIVHIDTVHLEIKQLQVVSGENNTAIQINEVEMDKLPPEMQQQMLAIRDHIRRRHG